MARQCCCDDTPPPECCIDTDELPVITITGMTGGGWEPQSSCCWKQVFLYDTTPSTVKLIGGDINHFDITETCVAETLVLLGPDYRTNPEGTVLDPLPTDTENCCKEPESCGERTNIRTAVGGEKYVLCVRPYSITVYLTKLLIACEDSECKYVVGSKYTYKYEPHIVPYILHQLYRNDVSSNDCCDEFYHDHIEIIQQVDFDVDDVVCDIDDSSNEISFTRFIMYDTIPVDETVSFGDDNIPLEGCEFPEFICLLSTVPIHEQCVMTAEVGDDPDAFFCTPRTVVATTINPRLPSRCPRDVFWTYVPGGTIECPTVAFCEEDLITTVLCPRYILNVFQLDFGTDPLTAACIPEPAFIGVIAETEENFFPYINTHIPGCCCTEIIEPSDFPLNLCPTETFPFEFSCRCYEHTEILIGTCDLLSDQTGKYSHMGLNPITYTYEYTCAGYTQQSICVDAPEWEIIFE